MVQASSHNWWIWTVCHDLLKAYQNCFKSSNYRVDSLKPAGPMNFSQWRSCHQLLFWVVFLLTFLKEFLVLCHVENIVQGFVCLYDVICYFDLTQVSCYDQVQAVSSTVCTYINQGYWCASLTATPSQQLLVTEAPPAPTGRRKAAVFILSKASKIYLLIIGAADIFWGACLVHRSAL